MLPPQAFLTLARDIMGRLSRKMVSERRRAASRAEPPALTTSLFLQNDNQPSAGGGPVKIAEQRSRKNFFRCSLL